MKPAYTPPCRLRVKRLCTLGTTALAPGTYRVWWGRNHWLIDPLVTPEQASVYSMLVPRPQERPR
jgi:hypothetical protein